MSYATDKTVTLPTAAALIYENAEFAGWYETADFTSPILTGWVAGEQTGNKTLYAKWNYTATATATDIEDVITNLTDSGSYTIAVTGAITDDTISTIRSALKTKSAAKIHLDLLGTTGIETIGDEAFAGCTSLASMSIPASVTSIGEGAFTLCSSLTSVNIPDSVASIGIQAFAGCSSLTQFTVDSANANYTASADGKMLLSKDGTTLIACPAASGAVSIPTGVITIGWFAFASCSSLTEVSVPNSLTTIGTMAFAGCSSLTEVSVPNSLTTIGTMAFAGCSSLTQFTVSNTNAKYSVSTDGKMLLSKDGKTLIACPSASGAVSIPTGVTTIGTYAFNGCKSLTSVNIPNSVTTIKYNAFTSCSSLSEVNIPASVTYIEWYVFNGCSNLTSVTFADTTSTWKVTDSSSYTGGSTINVKDPTGNATYLTSTYVSDYWYKK